MAAASGGGRQMLGMGSGLLRPVSTSHPLSPPTPAPGLPAPRAAGCVGLSLSGSPTGERTSWEGAWGASGHLAGFMGRAAQDAPRRGTDVY